MKLACPDQPGKAARVWITRSCGVLTKFAVDNPCTQSLVFPSFLTYASGSARDAMLVKPGTHFNWGRKRIAMYQDAIIAYWSPYFRSSQWECMGPTTVWVVSKYNDVRPAMDLDYPGETC